MRIPKSLLAAGAVGLIVAGRKLLRNARRISFTGKIVVITGGARGLGLALAREFAHEGARIAICSRTDEQLDRAEKELAGLGADVLARHVDVSNEEQVNAFIEAVQAQWGQIDVLVNCAGVIQVGPYNAMGRQDYEHSLQTHFWGAFNLIQAVLPQMRARREGRIVNIASLGGKMAVPHMLPYSTGKFALVGYSEGLRAETLREGIYVTTVCPGLMLTGSHDQAQIKGDNAKQEYVGFKTMDAVMGIEAAEAAQRIVEACRYGEAELVFPFSARASVILRGLAPSFLQEGMALVARVLPGSASVSTKPQTGNQLEGKALTDDQEDRLEHAKHANNES